jgi:hypothetical protein
MYQPRTPGYSKNDAEMRWALPDRVFFACGACHILAYAFLERRERSEAQAIWIKPSAGYTGNHIFVDGGIWVFDYHGYSAKPDRTYLARCSPPLARLGCDACPAAMS